jgi:Fe-S cluster biogenesis protein NfuA
LSLRLNVNKITLVLVYLGGGCKICGSVEHLRRDCPELLKKKIKGTIPGHTMA